MSQVEIVALWAGLIASVAGIVLSVAALVFGVWVTNRATEVNNQTIRSLQKIESAVESLSDDTRNLIKAGWEKMLTNFGSMPADEEDKESEREMVSGLAAEARADLGLNKATTDSSNTAMREQVEKIERVLENIQESLGAFRNLRARNRKVDTLVQTIGGLSPEARTLLSAISASRHLRRKEYQQLSKQPGTGRGIRELRKEGLLVPLSGLDDEGERIPVYWLPSDSMANSVRAALLLLPDSSRYDGAEVVQELKNVGYELE